MANMCKYIVSCFGANPQKYQTLLPAKNDYLMVIIKEQIGEHTYRRRGGKKKVKEEEFKFLFFLCLIVSYTCDVLCVEVILDLLQVHPVMPLLHVQ